MLKESVSSRLQIRLLGEFQLLYNDQSIVGLHADRPQSLLAFLLLHRGVPQSRRHLAFLLWPDSTEGQARTNLRNLWHTLRRTLPEADTYLLSDSATVQWQLQADYDLDVARYEAALKEAKQAGAPDLIRRCLETAVSLYQGDLLPGNYDDWIIPIREELRQKYLAALHQLVALLEQQQAYREAARYCQILLQQDPFDETAAIQLMRLQALNGDRSSVRRTYETLVGVLERELGVEPAAATQEAYSQLLRLDLLPTPPIPAVAELPEWRPQPLPVPATRFIGREGELAEINQRLNDPNCRLLTLLGLGGMGKTRLALQTAVVHQAAFPNGVAFVALAGLQTADLLAPTIADALQFRFAGSAEPTEQLFAFLSQKEMLLVLDNFEHLLSANGGGCSGECWVGDLLQAAPKLKLLVTSRQRLELQEEWVFEIQGMALPPVTRDISLIDNSAVALFWQSAVRADSHFEPSDENLKDVAHICQLVGGMPLGIELAASWVRVLSCAEIIQEIERSLDFLQAGTRNVPVRHRSIEAVFDHSWQLLSNSEQQVLTRLSVFQGGFTREAAEQVAGADLATLSALVDKSLLQRAAASRFALHELVRQFAASRLHKTKEVEQETRNFHAVYYLTLLQNYEAQLQSHQQKAAIVTLTADIDNIRLAWEQGVAEEAFALLRQAAYPLWYFYELRNYFQEGERRMASTARFVQSRLAEDAGETSAVRDEMIALLGELWAYGGFYSIHLAKGQTALELTTAAVTLLRPVNAPRSLAYALCFHVLILRTKSNYEEAIACSQEGLVLSRALGQHWQEALFLVTLGAIAHNLGNYAQAYDYLKEAIVVSRTIGDPRHLAFVGNELSRTAQMLGRPAEAESVLNEVMVLTKEIDDRLGMGMALEQLARAAQSAGNDERAHALLEECVAMYAKSGDVFHHSQALNHFGHFLLARHYNEEARQCFLQACWLADSMGANLPVVSALVGIARLQGQSEAWEEALEAVSYVQEHPDSSPDVQKSAVQLESEAVEQLSPAQVTRVRARVKERPFTTWLHEEVLGSNGRYAT